MTFLNCHPDAAKPIEIVKQLQVDKTGFDEDGSRGGSATLESQQVVLLSHSVATLPKATRWNYPANFEDLWLSAGSLDCVIKHSSNVFAKYCI